MKHSAALLRLKQAARRQIRKRIEEQGERYDQYTKAEMTKVAETLVGCWLTELAVSQELIAKPREQST